ncbi:Bzip transcription factor Pap1 bound To Dna, partial [Calycina marina]
KRRDQNRVSQRAFRQRKEKHTKELEAKVSELEQLLESASYENSLAASQMGRMGEELQ